MSTEHETATVETSNENRGGELGGVECRQVEVDDQTAQELGITADDAWEDNYEPPDPPQLNEAGKVQFNAGRYKEAIETWKLALKEALKLSVRQPSRGLFDLQMTLRMNLAMGLMKEDDLLMAKEHMMVVFENKHDTPKVFYRLGAIYLGLQDYDKALMVVTGGLKEFPEDAALKNLKAKIMHENHQYQVQSSLELKKAVNLDLNDERSHREIPEGLKQIKREDWKDVLTSGEAERERWQQLASELIEWRHQVTHPAPGEIQSDLDDWGKSDLWRKCWTAERLQHDRTVLHSTLPLSLLSILASVLVDGTEPPRKEIIFRGSSCRLASLDDIAVDLELRRQCKLRIVDWLSRNSSISASAYRPFTIHCLGARGDMEMDTKWGLILERCPGVESVQIIMVGFRDADDSYSRRLSPNDEYLSPPLVKKNGWRLCQKLIARLYKGDYVSFLNSKLVQSTLGSAGLKGERIAAGQSELNLPSILSNMEHPFYPDLVVIPEPDFSVHFKDWLQALALLALSNVIIVFLGQSVMSEWVSHEAISIPKVLRLLRFRFLTRLEWNKFAVPLDPGEDAPPMPIRGPGNTVIDYKGASGKFAVTIAVQGAEDESSRELLIRLVLGEAVEDLVAAAGVSD